MGNRVTIPVKPFEDETPIFVMGMISVSLRQSLTIVISGSLWFLAMKLTTAVVPINLIFALAIYAWIPCLGLFLSFKQKDGRPYEEHLTKVIMYFVGDRYYILIDPKANLGNIEDAQWEDIDDDDDVFPTF